jgi:hypothetical protein
MTLFEEAQLATFHSEDCSKLQCDILSLLFSLRHTHSLSVSRASTLRVVVNNKNFPPLHTANNSHTHTHIQMGYVLGQTDFSLLERAVQTNCKFSPYRVYYKPILAEYGGKKKCSFDHYIVRGVPRKSAGQTVGQY